MIIDKLLELRRISIEDYDEYMLFAASEMGRRYLQRKVEQTFMETPKVNPDVMNQTTMSFQDGRRDIFRDIKITIEKVNQIIKEFENDNDRKQRESEQFREQFPDIPSPE